MDADLEKAIDDLGRERVFGRARAIGWTAEMMVPKWVWWGIVAELRSEASAVMERQK